MKPSALAVWLFALLLLSPALAQNAPPTLKTFNRLPLSFEANQGQTDGSVKFISRSQKQTVFLTDGGATFTFLTQVAGSSTSANPQSEIDYLRLQIVGANGAAKVSGEERLPTHINYFVGNDPTRWRRNIPTYAKVRYKGVYPGIDVVYYGSESLIEYDFLILPGGDPSKIKLQVEGSRDAQLLPTGEILVGTPHGVAHLKRPNIYEENHGIKKAVAGKYTLDGNFITFKITEYDHDARLIIDPTLTYSTYLAGSNGDMGYGIATDASGNAYVVGSTLSANFPTVNAVQPVNAGFDAFVTKLNPTGMPIYSTFLGGGGR